jgi:hypothetical protein
MHAVVNGELKMENRKCSQWEPTAKFRFIEQVEGMVGAKASP